MWQYFTTYDNGCNTEIYGLIRIATDDAGSYPWLILSQIRECVTWALRRHLTNALLGLVNLAENEAWFYIILRHYLSRDANYII